MAFVIGKHQVVLRNAAAEHHRETAATGQLDDAIVLPLVAVTAHQAQLHGLRIEGKQSYSAYEAFHALGAAYLAHIQHAQRVGGAQAGTRSELLGVVARSHDAYAVGRQVEQLGDLGLLRLVQRHHAVERADSCRNAVFLQIVVTQLAEVGGMANAPNRARTALRASRTFRNR